MSPPDILSSRTSFWVLTKSAVAGSIAAALKGESWMQAVVLGEDTATREQVALDATERQQGLYVIGGTGTGKTTLLLNLAYQDICSGQGLCFLDPHGDAINDLLRRVPPKREQDVIVLDVGDTHRSFGLNLYDCPEPTNVNLIARLADQATGIFRKLLGAESEYQTWGPRVEQVMRNCAYLLLSWPEDPKYTMAEIPLILTNPDFRKHLLGPHLTHPPWRFFWETTYPAWERTPSEREAHIESTLNRVGPFLENPILYHIVGQSTSTVDFRWVMDAGKILLVRLPSGQVGDGIVNLLGSVVVALIRNAAFSRAEIPEAQRRPFSFYADEFHRFITPDFTEILEQTRKYGIAPTLSHQTRAQLDYRKKGATLQVANLVVFKIGSPDAEELAGEFDRTPPEPVMTGYRPRLIVPQKPLEILTGTRGHPNPSVQHLTATVIAPLTTFLDTWDRKYPDVPQEVKRSTIGGFPQQELEFDYTGYWRPPITRLQFYRQPPATPAFAQTWWPPGHNIYATSIPEVTKRLDRYFHDIMTVSVAMHSNAEAEQLAAIVLLLAGYIGFAEDERQVPPATRDAVVAYLSALVKGIGTWGERDRFVRVRQEYYQAEFAERIAQCKAKVESINTYEREGWPGLVKQSNDKYQFTPWQLAPLTDEYVNYRVPRFLAERAWNQAFVTGATESVVRTYTRAVAEEEVGWFEEFVNPLLELREILAQEQLHVESAEYEPIYDHPRPYADVENQIANMLVNLPRFQARCKLGLDEYTISVEPM